MRWLLAAHTDLQAAVIKKMKTKKGNLMSVLSERNRERAPDRRRMKGTHIYSGLDLRFAGVASKDLENLSTCCGCEVAKTCHFDAVTKRRCTGHGENVPPNEVALSPGSMITPFPSDFIAMYVRFHQPSPLSDAESLTSLVSQEIRDNT